MVDEVNGFTRRAQVLTTLIRDVGTPVILLGVVVGWFTGWIPFRPLDNISLDIRAHDTRVQAAITTQARTSLVLERLTAVMERLEYREQLTTCDRIKDVDIRQRCLR